MGSYIICAVDKENVLSEIYTVRMGKIVNSYTILVGKPGGK
jgi:hypothetical protein